MEMPIKDVKELVDLYQTLAAHPTLNSAYILNSKSDTLSIQCTWTQRNLDTKMDQRFTQIYDIHSNWTSSIVGFPIDTTTEQMFAFTEDEELKAVLRQVTIDKTTKQFIEIWDKYHLVKNYDLSAMDVHGEVYTDVEFRSFEWCPNKRKILYIAEKKLPKSKPFYKQEPLNEKKEDNEVIVGNEYIYKPHWGEQLVGKHRPVIAVLDTMINNITILSEIPDNVSPGQVSWIGLNENIGIIGVAWKHEPVYLGLTACTSRCSWIFSLLDGKYEKLSDDGYAVHSPRVSPNRHFVVWVQRKAGAVPHHNAQEIMYRDLITGKNEKLLEETKAMKLIAKNHKFYGMYNRLPRRCWSEDAAYIFFSTSRKYTIRSYFLNIKSKILTHIEDGKNECNFSILDVKNNLITFMRSCAKRPGIPMLGRFEYEDLKYGLIFLIGLVPTTIIPKLENMLHKNFEYSYDDEKDIEEFNYTYFGPVSEKSKVVPLIVMPHGGPHSSSTNVFSLEAAFMACAGFGILQVNYRGSTGMGSATVEYLQGKVGDVDVKDCITATKQILKDCVWLDPERIGLCGGSHGGFIVAHLSGQAPNLYKAVVARNPVIDIATMFGTSDIPDWCITEAGYTYDFSTGPWPKDVNLFVKMREVSPIMHVDTVKAPTLICIGTKDLRVPCSQGTMWYKRLKTNNVKTKLLVYDDNHQLSTGAVEIDHILNNYLWLLEHIYPEKIENKN
ncbi:hypothetical protein P5V15_006565 [Pogonomyrmex californicus]